MAEKKRKRGCGCLIVIVVLLAALAAAGAWLWQRYDAFAATPMSGLEKGETLLVERGDSLPTVVRKLRAAGVEVGEPMQWRVLAKQLGAAGRLQVGEYALEPGTSPRALLIAMRDGKIISYRFTIVDGWNMRDLRAALARATPLKQQIGQLDDSALMKALGHPGQHPEGRFLPETYQYTGGDSDLDVLKRAYAAMDKAVAAAWAARDPNSVLKSPAELLIMASIVEKETGIPEERAQIAGLFERRLKLGMKLETDPTVIYGIGAAYDGNIRKRDLQTDTPYNTYTRVGLPPTPIAMPGLAALKATANPAPGDALFFVASGDGSGRSLFAATYAQHQANVRIYLQRYRQNQTRGQPEEGKAVLEEAAEATDAQAPAPASSGATR
ncbi:endolytic transglycosylase MltG [Lysobacter capsici]|uniref:endolytic transglycosylase MltG n=1 Tax=Lysobacter capsici TaxID=435897 RepID=UPI001FF637E7|nr:endolytic transglycosylase MltG [Lysobacter capsici]UOF13201.1 endolytic transglycosylase MltG [Lysobacter capsici]